MKIICSRNKKWIGFDFHFRFQSSNHFGFSHVNLFEIKHFQASVKRFSRFYDHQEDRSATRDHLK